MSTPGIKFDEGKFRFSLLPLKAIKQIILVLEFGARKYAFDNWKWVSEAEERYFDAAQRHLIAHRLGESDDAETGLPHLAHAACCIIFLLWFEITRREADNDSK